MKISEKVGASNIYPAPLKDDKIKNATDISDFSKHFKDIEQKNMYNYLNDFVARIEEQGMRIAKNVDINELRYYRKMVSEFLYQAVYASCTFENEDTRDSRGRLRKYAMVTKVNKKIDELVKMFMNNEKDHMQILKMIDDIRGLLIDLMM